MIQASSPPQQFESLPSSGNAGPAVLIGIVTVLYNSEEVLPGFFCSLARQIGIAFRLFVIDNSPSSTGLEISRSLARQYAIEAVFVFNNAEPGRCQGQ